MNPAIGITLLLTVLQVASGQKVISLTACLVDQSLRLDCRHENTTASLSTQYEFSLTRDSKKHVLISTVGVPEHTYRSRTNFTNKYNMKVLYLSGFTTKDEGLYTCELRPSSQQPSFSKNVTVLRGSVSPSRASGRPPRHRPAFSGTSGGPEVGHGVRPMSGTHLERWLFPIPSSPFGSSALSCDHA
ncbi:Thy-1 cell surface antigen [Rhinolophus ferrumequinum]|uniref:Thy-1 membrane glycoprotein n=1 Tax=Rhinolophus ferrumequinum TaxID=59479 RepID=A0A7J7WBB8_RHIFE|nr:Thy-1 cell surface antigen [Rhinolophus ferrumequinum]